LKDAEKRKLLEKRLKEVREDVSLSILDLVEVYKKFGGGKNEESS